MATTTEHVLRATASFLAAAVFLATASEWLRWGYQRRQPWRYMVAASLNIMALFEANVLWSRVDRAMK